MKDFEVLFVDKLNLEKFDRLNKYLTKKMWDQYYQDPNFLTCVYPGVKERASKISLCAVSADSYTRFDQVFNAYIQDFFGLDTRNDRKRTDMNNEGLNKLELEERSLKTIQNVKFGIKRNFENFDFAPGISRE